MQKEDRGGWTDESATFLALAEDEGGTALALVPLIRLVCDVFIERG